MESREETRVHVDPESLWTEPLVLVGGNVLSLVLQMVTDDV